MEDRRLLILDDENSMGLLIMDIAETADIPSRFITNPADLITLIRNWKPTHVAIDLKMPKMDGVQVMEALANSGCNAKIIILSGVDERVLDAAARSAKEFGLNFAGVLSKPFTPKGLLQLLSPPSEASVENRRDNSGRRQGVMMTPGSLRQDLDEECLEVYYQPKIDCQNNRLVGFEALARIRHPQHGLIFPDSFISVAEESGMICDLTTLVLDKALSFISRKVPFDGLGQDRAEIPVSHVYDVRVAINVSAQVLRQKRFVDQLLDACTAHSVAPDRLILELTETTAMENPEESLATLTRLRVKGFRLSIDDFGIGYSSMLQLVKLPFSEIKVDKSFVMTAQRSEESRSVISSVVALGRSLGLSSVAEGVEDPETLEFLRRIGCDVAQGYLFSQPMPEAEALNWMRTKCNKGHWSPSFDMRDLSL